MTTGKLPRCPCGTYAAAYAEKIDHHCKAGDPPAEQRYARTPESTVASVIEMRATGKSWREIGVALGISHERARQIAESSGILLCPGCKAPTDRARSAKGRVPKCSVCHAEAMANRPSKASRRTGYRESKQGHQRAWIVRFAKQGMTIAEIADRLGVTYFSLWSRIKRMRADGIDVPVPDGNQRYYQRGKESA